MGYNMKGSPAKMGTIKGTSGHASALKQKTYVKTEKEGKSKYHYKKNIKKDEHNIRAERLNTTGQTCATCGAPKKGHTTTKSHKFKLYTPPGPDTKSPE